MRLLVKCLNMELLRLILKMRLLLVKDQRYFFFFMYIDQIIKSLYLPSDHQLHRKLDKYSATYYSFHNIYLTNTYAFVNRHCKGTFVEFHLLQQGLHLCDAVEEYLHSMVLICDILAENVPSDIVKKIMKYIYHDKNWCGYVT